METAVWSTFVDLKFKIYCLSHLIKKYQTWERNINVVLALVSSSSIATWVIWQMYPKVWASIIVVSQVISVVKPYFPYYKFVKEMNEKSVRLELLCLDFEHLWYLSSNYKISEDETNAKFLDLKKILVQELKFSDETLFDVNKSILEKSHQEVQNYLKSNYSIN